MISHLNFVEFWPQNNGANVGWCTKRKLCCGFTTVWMMFIQSSSKGSKICHSYIEKLEIMNSGNGIEVKYVWILFERGSLHSVDYKSINKILSLHCISTKFLSKVHDFFGLKDFP